MKVIRSYVDYHKIVKETELDPGTVLVELTDCIIDFNFDLPHDSLEKLFINDEVDYQITLTNCYFNRLLRIPDFSDNLTFVNCHFYHKFDMNNSNFSGKVRLRKCHFYDDTNFYNCKFNDLAD